MMEHAEGAPSLEPRHTVCALVAGSMLCCGDDKIALVQSTAPDHVPRHRASVRAHASWRKAL